MKKSKLLTFILIPIALAFIANVNIFSAGAEDPTNPKPKGTGTVEDTTDPKPKGTGTVEDTTDPKPNIANHQSDTSNNTLSFIALGFSVLNSIGLGILFLLNKKAVNKIQEKAKSSEQRIESLKSKGQSLDSHIKKVDGDQQNSSHKTNKEIEGLKRSIEEILRKAASVQQPAAIPQSNNYGTGRQSSPSERYTPEPVYRQLSHTDYYNDRQSDFQNKYQITPVSREAENLNQSLAAQTDSVVLAGDRQGNYWLFSDNSEIYLVPKQNLKITDNRISTTKDLFECQDYNEQNYDSFILIRPAVLTSKGNGNWQLKEKGKLQFG